MMNYKIIYEDNHIIVCHKFNNVLSQKDSTNDIDMVTLLKKYLKEKYQKEGNVYLGLVHRLDRRVSGVMVFAKTSKAASRLSEAIRNKEFDKKYLAIVVGEMNGKKILQNKLEKVNNYSQESEEGKECLLEYQVLNQFKMDNNIFTVLEINLLTGRFNQIRMQLALANHPIINDFKYGYRGKNYNDFLGLVCYSLTFPHPVKKELMTFYKLDEYIDIDLKTNNWIEYLNKKR